MNWIKIDENNLPEGEVLAASYEDLYKSKGYGYLYCDEGRVFMNLGRNVKIRCTHYIDISNIPNPDDQESQVKRKANVATLPREEKYKTIDLLAGVLKKTEGVLGASTPKVRQKLLDYIDAL